MIVKVFELDKINLNKNKLFLLYGENQGYKDEVIHKKFKIYTKNIYSYEESEILSNQESFFNNILSRSFFEDKKLIIIRRISDKIKDISEEILEKKIDDLVVVLNAGVLEKKSKLRSLFEKSKSAICIPFYEDNNQTLSSIINKFFRDNKLSISQESINLITQRCRGDRKNLGNELEKIKNFMGNRNKIEVNDLLKLTNLAENYSVSELVDNCLAKNKRKTINILNENNYSLEDCILIIRIFLMKSKKLLKLSDAAKYKKNIDDIISSFKPPVFWKDREITKQQMRSWSYNNIEDLIYKVNETELLIKKNSTNSVNILSNFIIEQVTIVSN